MIITVEICKCLHSIAFKSAISAATDIELLNNVREVGGLVLGYV
jgi:hypothetical protein